MIVDNIPVYDSWGQEIEKLAAYDRNVRISVLADDERGISHLDLCFKVDFVLKSKYVSVKGSDLQVSKEEVSCVIPNEVLETMRDGVLSIHLGLRNQSAKTTEYTARIAVEGRPPAPAS